MKRLLTNAMMILATTAVVTLAACSSGSSTNANNVNANETGSFQTLTGKLTGADGSPVSGASVAIINNDQASLIKAAVKGKNGFMKRLPTLTDDEGDECADISVDVIGGKTAITDCTAEDGTFVFSGEIPCGFPVTFYAQKGSFSLSVTKTFSCTMDGDVTVDIVENFTFDEDCGTAGNACSFENARMAVVTGRYDTIQDVLAKLGFGHVTEEGRLDMSQTFDFTLIDGYSSLPDGDFENLPDFLSDIANLNQYDIIFINCGPDDILATDPAVQARLQEYVNGGGKLYVTDWGYNFVEQPFPSFMNFYLGGDDAATAETPHVAKVGNSGIHIDASVDAALGSWLDNVTVNSGNVDENCFDTAPNTVTGARFDGSRVRIGHFLGGWVVMTDPHTGLTPAIWVSGPNPNPVDDNAPLTVTSDQGEGRILYSSYHTAGTSCATAGFWPQERILQYLVFEL